MKRRTFESLALIVFGTLIGLGIGISWVMYEIEKNYICMVSDQDQLLCAKTNITKT